MIYKKLTLIIFLTLLAVSFVSAEDQISSENQITLGDVNFTIPDGFEEKNMSVNGSDNFNQSNDYGEFKYFVNNDSQDILMIQVGDLEEIDLSEDDAKGYLNSSSDVEEKEIQGKKGYFFPYGDSYGFGFIEDGKLIVLHSSDESIFEEVILNK